MLALMGDAIDNVKGVPGIGEKGARELIADHGSLDALLARGRGACRRSAIARRCSPTPRTRASAARWCACTVTCRWTIDLEALRFRGPDQRALLRAVQQAGLQHLVTEFAPTAADVVQHVQHLRRPSRTCASSPAHIREAGRVRAATWSTDGAPAMQARSSAWSSAPVTARAAYVPLAHTSLDACPNLAAPRRARS